MQAEVNRLAKGGSATKKSVTAVAKEVLAGKWGNGDDRKKKLQAAGYNYNAVQKEVNRLMRYDDPDINVGNIDRSQGGQASLASFLMASASARENISHTSCGES